MSREVHLLIECNGSCCRVAYAQTDNLKYPAKEYLDGLNANRKQKREMMALISYFHRLANVGLIHNKEQFSHLEGPLWEFKKFQHRVLGFYGNFRGDRYFWLTNGYTKKRGRARPQDIARAHNVMRQWSEFLRVAEED